MDDAGILLHLIILEPDGALLPVRVQLPSVRSYEGHDLQGSNENQRHLDGCEQKTGGSWFDGQSLITRERTTQMKRQPPRLYTHDHLNRFLLLDEDGDEDEDGACCPRKIFSKEDDERVYGSSNGGRKRSGSVNHPLFTSCDLFARRALFWSRMTLSPPSRRQVRPLTNQSKPCDDAKGNPSVRLVLRLPLAVVLRVLRIGAVISEPVQGDETVLPYGKVEVEEEHHPDGNMDEEPLGWVRERLVGARRIAKEGQPDGEHEEGRHDEDDASGEELLEEEEDGPSGLEDVGDALLMMGRGTSRDTVGLVRWVAWNCPQSSPNTGVTPTNRRPTPPTTISLIAGDLDMVIKRQ